MDSVFIKLIKYIKHFYLNVYSFIYLFIALLKFLINKWTFLNKRIKISYTNKWVSKTKQRDYSVYNLNWSNENNF